MDKANGSKNALFFLSRALAHHSFTLNLQLLICDSYMSWSTRFVSLTPCVGFSIFNSVLFLLKFIFLFIKICRLFDLNGILPFKIKIIEKLRTVLVPDLSFLTCNKTFWNSIISAWVGAFLKLTWRQIFKT